MAGIVSIGAYVPCMRLRRRAIAEAHAWLAPEMLTRAEGERAAANWDEDPVTMAVEAARDCLRGRGRHGIRRIVLASTSHPFLDRQNAGIVKEALNLSDEVATVDVAGSQRSATSALLDCLYAAKGGAGQTICIGSEKRRVQPASSLEMVAGDAAAALLIGTEDVALEFVGGGSVSIDFVDHFRAAGSDFDYFWEGRWIRDEGYAKVVPAAVESTLERLGLRASEIDHFIMSAPLKNVHIMVAKAVGIEPEKVASVLDDKLGDAGSAQPLVMLANSLAKMKPDSLVVLVGFGQGCDVLVFRSTKCVSNSVRGLGVAGWLARRKEETSYFKYLVLNGHVAVDRGPRAEFDQKTPLTALYRSRKAVLGLVGGRCKKTGAVQFPKSMVSIAPDSRAIGTQEDYPLAERRAVIVTYTADRLTFSPNPPTYYGVIDFDGGGRMTTEFVDFDDDAVKVGVPVRMAFRIKTIDDRRRFIRYFWKAVPYYSDQATAGEAHG